MAQTACLAVGAAFSEAGREWGREWGRVAVPPVQRAAGDCRCVAPDRRPSQHRLWRRRRRYAADIQAPQFFWLSFQAHASWALFKLLGLTKPAFLPDFGREKRRALMERFFGAPDRQVYEVRGRGRWGWVCQEG